MYQKHIKNPRETNAPRSQWFFTARQVSGTTHHGIEGGGSCPDSINRGADPRGKNGMQKNRPSVYHGYIMVYHYFPNSCPKHIASHSLTSKKEIHTVCHTRTHHIYPVKGLPFMREMISIL